MTHYQTSCDVGSASLGLPIGWCCAHRLHIHSSQPPCSEGPTLPTCCLTRLTRPRTATTWEHDRSTTLPSTNHLPFLARLAGAASGSSPRALHPWIACIHIASTTLLAYSTFTRLHYTSLFYGPPPKHNISSYRMPKHQASCRSVAAALHMPCCCRQSWAHRASINVCP